ncbi:MAG TPA: DciA family protein [Candidatus Competibacteraceae bacterium]|nr:DUF721 domain-containing protein [Candidatus Competibacteraceae bacterium]MCP5133795.1 DUF721 domain-containing protein [Gammaproteobacteria bacterium]HPF58141.1 DciA family protein [Candidatus Competibacteraceae bacterium]
MDETCRKDQVDSGVDADMQSDRRIIARQHTSKMLKMLRGYGPKEPSPAAESRTGVVADLASAHSALPAKGGGEPLTAAGFTPARVADAKASYVRLVEDSLDRRSLSAAVPAASQSHEPHAAQRSSTQHTIASLGESLPRRSGVLGQLINKTNELAKSSRIFHAYLPPHLREHALLVRMDEEVWTVRTDSASWATRLRYKLYDIRQALGQQLGITLPKPHIRVEPVTAPPPLRRPPQALTQKSARLIEQIARDEANPRLSAALHHLAQHAVLDDS